MSFEPSFLPPSRPSRGYRGPTTRRGLRILATSMLVLTVLIVGGFGWRAWDLAANGIETDAVITGWGESKDRLYVRFTSEDGRVVPTSFDEPGKIENYPRGSTIRVRYLPGDPTTARPVEESPVPPLLVFVGGVLLLVSLGLSVYAWRYAPAKLGRPTY